MSTRRKFSQQCKIVLLQNVSGFVPTIIVYYLPIGGWPENHDPPMFSVMTSGYIMLDGVLIAAAMARLDRGFTGQSRSGWLRQVAGRIRFVIKQRIPVGFEDETGFHLGEQPAHKADRMDWERAGIFSYDEYF